MALLARAAANVGCASIEGKTVTAGKVEAVGLVMLSLLFTCLIRWHLDGGPCRRAFSEDTQIRMSEHSMREHSMIEIMLIRIFLNNLNIVKTKAKKE